MYTTPAKTEQEILEFFQEESTGVECSRQCEGYRCKKCATGSKQISLKQEREYNYFKSLMTLDKKGTKSNSRPYWVTRQPWIQDGETLINNRDAVLGIMNSTLRKLCKNPSW